MPNLPLPSRKLAQVAALTVVAGLIGSPLLAPPLSAQTTTAPATAPASEDAKKQKIVADRTAAFAAAEKVQQLGPQKIKLRDQGFIDLPQGYIFVPQPEADGILIALGGFKSSETVGLFFPAADDQNWWARLNFEASGYVKDEEAKVWNADELLNTLKSGTDSGNESRVERGFNPIEVTGWIETPVYDSASHRLVWSAMVRDKGSTTDAGSVNFNTYALGREGYFSLNLITGPASIAKDKASARALLAGISYDTGKDYGDFNASTDHIAEYGIAALIGGVVAKKLGILALGAAFFLKFAKIIALAVFAFGAGFMRFFRRKKPDQ